MLSSACYEHKQIIGLTPERMTECETGILDVCNRFTTMATLGAFCLIIIISWFRRIASRS